MKTYPIRLGVFLVFGLLLLAGCGALNGAGQEETATIPVAVLYQGSQCRGTITGATWIGRPQELPPALRRSGDYQWNPDSEGLLWVNMGPRPTGGYRLELADPTARVRQSVATLQVTWQRPAPGSFVTQALTSPCLLLKMPHTGIRKIEVVDQDGRRRAEVALP